MANLPRWQWSLAFALVLLPAVANGQQCMGANDVSAQERSRRDTAVRFIEAINGIERLAHQARGVYVPLSERGAPTAPLGFVPRLVFDRWGYSIIVKDLFDSCGFALISDEHGIVYEARPIARPPHPPPADSSTTNTAIQSEAEDEN